MPKELRGNDSVWAAGNYSVTVKDKTIQGNWFRILKREEAHKHHGNSKVARATAKDKSTSVVADAGRVPEIAGKEVEKR